MEATAVIEDFSGIGNMSLVAALDILHAFDITTAAVPSTWLSTQTEGFGSPAQLRSAKFQQAVFDHWQRINDLAINEALVGYLGQLKTIELVSQWLANQSAQQIVIDPVMGDQGSLYPGLSPELPVAMRQLVQQATVITPNATELKLLADINPHRVLNDNLTKVCLEKLWASGYQGAVVLTGIAHGDQISCQLWRHPEQPSLTVTTPARPGHFYGTGDAFAALLSGLLHYRLPLEQAVQQANQLLQIAVQETAELKPTDRKYGLQLSQLMRAISGLQLTKSN